MVFAIGNDVDIQLTQGRVAAIDEVDVDVTTLRWHAWKSKAGKIFYAAHSFRNPDGTRSGVFLHQIIAQRMGIVGPPDHIDRNGLNNRRSNLRQATKAQQQAHRGLAGNNTSGYKGVHWDKRVGKWRARIMVAGKRRHLGHFDDLVEAAKAYDKASLELHGEFAVLNFPAKSEVPRSL